MSPSWYDLLDVEPDASTAEIRAAWKAKIADLDPTDRRFAVLNRAAKVLLDPASRAAYDAELAESADDEAATESEEEEPPATTPRSAPEQPPTTKPAPKKPAPKTPALPTKSGTAATTTPETQKATEKKATEKKATEKKATEKKPAANKPASVGTEVASLLGAVLAALVSLAFLTIAAVAYLMSEDESDVEDGVADARTAAEQAIVPILSYDAADLEAGRSSATSFMTDEFRGEYETLFDGLVEDNAANLGISVTGELLASAVVRADGDRVQVLVFADQTRTTAASAQPQIFSNQVTVTMADVDGRWLVDDLETGTAG